MNPNVFLLVRYTLGLQLTTGAITKITTGWSAEAYLTAATGPFSGVFQAIASSELISQLNIWGLLLIGLSLLSGLLLRPASMFGALLMLLYYFAHFDQNTAHGIIEYHLVYIGVFAFIAVCANGLQTTWEKRLQGRIQQSIKK